MGEHFMGNSSDPKVVRIERGVLEGTRPRPAGSNARLGAHGPTVRPSIVRVTDEDGATGFGLGWPSRERAEAIVGSPLSALFSLDAAGGATEAGLPLEFALWDLAAKRAGKPVYELAAAPGAATAAAPLRVRCYDTSLYIDDLHVDEEAEAADFIAGEAREGYERGHRAFKMKVGRGARHLPLEEGTRRDVAVIRAVRAAVGPDCALMIDANNGYNLNLTKRVLEETADCRLLWVEEAFHEDAVLYRDLKEWLAARGLETLIADGEGSAHPNLVDWAVRDGLIDVVQYDVFSPGFTRWRKLGPELDAAGVHSAPHHYGAGLGNYVTGHLAPAIRNFTFVEWDEAAMPGLAAPGLAAPGYAISEGWVTIPDSLGFGLELDEAVFARAVGDGGFVAVG